MHRHVATRTLQLIAVMLFGFGLAACGDDGDDAASTTSLVSESADDTSETTVDETPTTSEEQDQSSIVVSGTGLIVNTIETGDPLPLNFGADRSVVVDSVTTALGAAPNESDGSPECPNAQASVATWPDLILDFDANDLFLSWRLPGGSQLTNSDGLGLGSTRADLDDAMLASIDETSLGTEFGKAGSVSGLLSGPEDTATVDVLWAGDICAFR